MKKIKILNESWVDEIFEIEKKCFEYPWTKRFLKNEFENSYTEVYGLFVDEELIGFSIISLIYKYNLSHIKNFAVLPSKQNMGYGTFFLLNIHKILKKNKIKNIFLEVRISNERAIKLYRKFNYKIVEVLKNYYKNNNENAFRMWFNLEN
ncbi:MAG: ribosomal-protein-alanine N-acetyltransferase [Candidatus Mcinerneyibacterium aminivorans]|uniref:[Ribosomal protein bS18]-alanine N-acetyltransferase n=1 Tax=Candidatus Mcinerneyibacterium aminivorans TaxID=2703815 RepID=A0A5D0MBF5_9BACT|nr:MAG: ribosomal-protein-alanine N-acetyltransferase [Candidatus Mcinerneyibacterium aminivorans]